MKTSLVISGISLFLLSSCTNEEQFVNIYEAQKIVMSVEDFKFENQSRTSLTPTDDGATFTWAENDTVGIFPETGTQIAFPMTSGAGTNTATFTGGGWALKASTPYMAYYPMQGKFYLDKENIFVSYVGQSQTVNASTAHLGKYDYMVASATTPTTGTVNFQFKHLGALVRLKVTMKETSTLKSVTLQTSENDFITSGYIDLTATTPTINPKYAGYKSNSFGISLNNITVEANQDLIVYFLMPPVNLVNKTLKAIIHKDNGYFQEIILTGKNFEAGKPYELTTTMVSEEESPSVVNVETAGTFETLVKSQYPYPYQLTSLKITGNLNGTDIRYLRKLAGRTEDGTLTTGKLTHLDLSEANIVAGGDYYYILSEVEYNTENNIIGDHMFLRCNLKSIKFPNNITKIGQYACSYLTRASTDTEDGVSQLTSVVIPNGVTSIGVAAFGYCHSLATIDIPNTVEEIGGLAFYRCDALTTINIPNSVEIMGNAFQHCWGLEYVNLPENSNYSKIDGYTFVGCKVLKSLTIPANVTTIYTSSLGNSSNQSALEELHCKAATPPYLYDDAGLPTSCKIYVPQGSYSAYKASNSTFKNYTIIEE